MTRIVFGRASATVRHPTELCGGLEEVAKQRNFVKNWSDGGSLGERRGVATKTVQLDFSKQKQILSEDLIPNHGLLNSSGGNMKRCCAGVLVALLVAVAAVGMVCSSIVAQAQKPDAKAYSAANVQAGQNVFLSMCFQCHSVNKGETRVGPSLFGVMKGAHAKSPAEVRLQVTKGKGKMPPFGSILTPQQVDQVVAYLHSL